MFGSWPNVRLIPLPVDKLNSQTYSDYVTTVDFWLPFRNASFVLMFQTDSALFERVPSHFFEYDYVGAPWNVAYCDRRNRRLCTRVGNGGLSLRRVSAMIEVTRQLGGRKLQNPPDGWEDVHVSKKCPLEVARHFAVETLYSPAPVGVHNLWNYLPWEQTWEILGSRPFPGEIRYSISSDM